MLLKDVLIWYSLNLETGTKLHFIPKY